MDDQTNHVSFLDIIHFKTWQLVYYSAHFKLDDDYLLLSSQQKNNQKKVRNEASKGLRDHCSFPKCCAKYAPSRITVCEIVFNLDCSEEEWLGLVILYTNGRGWVMDRWAEEEASNYQLEITIPAWLVVIIPLGEQLFFVLLEDNFSKSR